MDLIGILEDVTDEDIQNQYGISWEEYLHPNAETIEKVKKAFLFQDEPIKESDKFEEGLIE